MSVVTMATKVMSPSSYSLGHRLGTEGEFHTCSQQANSPYHRATATNTAATAVAAARLKSTSLSTTCSSVFDEDDQDEQAKRNKLIQAATNRLRQKRLEIKLQAVMAQVVEMQCQLDIIKLDTSTSLQLLPSSNISETQLSHFEKRLAQHRTDLQHIFQHSSKREEPFVPMKPKETKASSTISSLLSNILYSKRNNGNGVMMREEEQQQQPDSDYSILGGSIHHHQKRRHYQQHGSMQNNVARTSSTATTITSASSSVSSQEIEDDDDIRPGSTETTSSMCWSSFDMMSDNNSILVQPLHQEMITNARNRHELLVLHSIPPSTIQAASETSKSVIERNALDDVLSFLNDMELNTHDDDRLVRDIYEILEQEYASAATPPGINSFPAFRLLQKLLDKGMRWIKFAIVMVLAIIINLKKGPKSFL